MPAVGGTLLPFAKCRFATWRCPLPWGPGPSPSCPPTRGVLHHRGAHCCRPSIRIAPQCHKDGRAGPRTLFADGAPSPCASGSLNSSLLPPHWQPSRSGPGPSTSGSPFTPSCLGFPWPHGPPPSTAMAHGPSRRTPGNPPPWEVPLPEWQPRAPSHRQGRLVAGLPSPH